MFNSDLNVLGVAIISVVALSFSTVSAQTILFQDNFDADNTTTTVVRISNPSDSSNPSDRASGTLKNDVRYKVRVDGTEFVSGSFSGNQVRIHDNALDFSAGLTLNANGQTGATFGDRYVRFEDSQGNEYDWGSELGNHYEISFQLHATNNNPLAFSISDTLTTGHYRPDSEAVYDFGLSTWTGNWHIGEDGLSQSISGATKAQAFDVRVLIDERNPQATASIFIDGDTSALHTFDIDFENNERYFQFNGRNGYGGTLDDLTIATYSAVPELSNFSLLTALFLLTGLFALRRSPQV